MRKETKDILEENFNDEERKLIIGFEKICKNSYMDINKQNIIWKYDQSLNGLGGYAAPLNPVMNPFNTWKNYRNVFRSLQYGRSDMFYGMRGRHIICDTGLHIETIIKILVSKNSVISFIKNKQLLGKNIEYLREKNTLDEQLYNKLKELIKIYNLAKHDTDEDNDITFDMTDGIVFYFTCRKLGNKLLNILNHFTCHKKYNINYLIDWEELHAVDENGVFISSGIYEILDLTEIEG